MSSKKIILYDRKGEIKMSMKFWKEDYYIIKKEEKISQVNEVTLSLLLRRLKKHIKTIFDEYEKVDFSEFSLVLNGKESFEEDEHQKNNDDCGPFAILTILGLIDQCCI